MNQFNDQLYKTKLSLCLKISIFATGCSGIVAEFVLSTLATYLKGNAVFQWTIVMSFMLFAMGIGSRISRYLQHNLLDQFIGVEFLLSLLCASSAIISYALAAYLQNIHLLIYLLGSFIGILIGMEIPLVTRMNESYEELRMNISGVMENDYYGALVGGLLFAFIALPFLGLTYSPIVLGSINLLVATYLLWQFYSIVRYKLLLFLTCVSLFICIGLMTIYAKPIIRFGEQSKYKDKIIYEKQTRYQKIVITKWRHYYWLYLNGQQQFSTYDEEKYHEPLVHPAMQLSLYRQKILVLGGGDGLAVREILKYKDVQSIDLVDLDPDMTLLAQNHDLLLMINQGALNDSRVTIYNQDAMTFLKHQESKYDVVIVDLPDPDTVDMIHVYSLSFYQMIHHALAKGGVMVTQATSPYFSNQAFLCILKTISHASFCAIPYHMHIPTMGEWAWILGCKKNDMRESQLKDILMKLSFDNVSTVFINQSAMISMLHFGKGIVDTDRIEKLKINATDTPIIHQYYQNGSWGVY